MVKKNNEPNNEHEHAVGLLIVRDENGIVRGDENEVQAVVKAFLTGTSKVYRPEGSTETVPVPKIFIFCNQKRCPGDRISDHIGTALAEDGNGLAGHWSSSHDFLKHDLGLTSNWKHDKYFAHYPGGFEVVWVEDPGTHEGCQTALKLGEKKDG